MAGKRKFSMLEDEAGVEQHQATEAHVRGLDTEYDNTASGLTATDIQAAIDEIAASKLEKMVDHHSFFFGDAVGRVINQQNYEVVTVNSVDADTLYPPGSTYNFEVVAKRNTGSGNVYIRLYDVTNGVQLVGLVFTETDLTKKQSTYTAPTSDIIVEVQVKIDAGTTGKLASAASMVTK